MKAHRDFVRAKQAISSRLLKRGLRGRAISRAWTQRVDAAMASARENVHAVVVGLKLTAGKRTKNMSVRFYVTQKLPKSMIAPGDLLPTKIDGLVTDVLESPPAMALASLTKWSWADIARTSSRMHLIATSRARFSSRASSTTPMPPSPILWRIR